MSYPLETIYAAKMLYLKRYKPEEIAKKLRLNSARVVYNWVKRHGWEAMVVHESHEEALARRVNLLAERENKTDNELKEFELCCKQLLEYRKLDTKAESSSQDNFDNNEGRKNKSGNKKGSRKSRKKKNDISMLTAEDFEREFHSKLYWHQKVLLANKDKRTRNCLKSRQLGYTWYFAGEAFEHAVLNGIDQNFLSASRNQSDVFLGYIRAMAKDWFDIELTGNPCELSNGATLRPLATNAATAQAYSGDFYMDECFWIPSNQFEELQKVASAMATHKHYRKTYFSTPSTIQHAAYKLWNGTKFKKEHPKRAAKWPTKEELEQGVVCPDKHWRFSCSMEQAVAMGFDRVDVEELKDEYSAAEYENLYNCGFVDTTYSVIGQNHIESAISDLDNWHDFTPSDKFPFGQNPVWLGFDPSRRKDNSTCAVVAPPTEGYKKFRVLDRFSWRNESFEFQAEQIKKLTLAYNVTYIGIDITGIGEGVFENVQAFFPLATAIRYSMESKKQMVEKAKDVFSSKRIEWDSSQQDIGPAFMSIKQEVTRTGLITYASDRTAEAGHADVAWSIMHTLINEPNNYSNQRSSTWDLS